MNQDKPNIAALILAAGESKRLGQPKQLIRYKGKPLLVHTIDLVKAAGISEIHVVLGAHSDQITPLLDDSQHIMINADWEEGMGSSLRIGVSEVERDQKIDGLLVMVCDQPEVTSDHLSSLIAQFSSIGQIVSSHYNGINGVPAIFPRSCFGELSKVTGDKGARSVIKGHDVIEVPCIGCEKDVDTSEDLKNLLG